jgi:hypothetical protein
MPPSEIDLTGFMNLSSLPVAQQAGCIVISPLAQAPEVLRDLDYVTKNKLFRATKF